jgi:hypothetical protein
LALFGLKKERFLQLLERNWSFLQVLDRVFKRVQGGGDRVQKNSYSDGISGEFLLNF